MGLESAFLNKFLREADKLFGFDGQFVGTHQLEVVGPAGDDLVYLVLLETGTRADFRQGGQERDDTADSLTAHVRVATVHRFTDSVH